MKIKGDAIKDHMPLLSGRLYRVEKNQTVMFEEKETDDIVYVRFCMKSGQYGIYGNEYKPPFVEDKGGKKADILALAIDEDRQCFSSWVFDVKKSVGGENVIYHLVEQLMESVRHKNAIAIYLEDYAEDVHIGYITREIQRDRIQETIVKKKAYLEKEKKNIKCMPALIGAGVSLQLLKEEARLKVLSAFQNDCMEAGKRIYKLENYISEDKDGRYVCELDVICS